MHKELIEPTPFLGENNQYHFVYRTHNLINQKEYTGKHSTSNLYDGYYGSGIEINKSILKYGIENFAVEILSFHNSSEDAYFEEWKIVDWEYVERRDTYNETTGGIGFDISHHVVRDKSGNTMSVSVDDSRYLSGELVSITKDKVIVKDQDGNKFQVLKTDSRYLSGELVGYAKGQTVVKDKDGNKFHVSVNDPRYLSGELVGHTTGIKNLGINKDKIVVKDKEGNKFQINKSEFYSTNNTLNHINKNKIVVKDKEGNVFQVSKDDPGWINGELVGHNSGNSNPSKFVKCPHCEKEGYARAMTRWHFDKCKFKV